MGRTNMLLAGCVIVCCLVGLLVPWGCSGPKYNGCSCLKARVNVKDGARSDGKKFENFNVGGSSGRIRVPQTWPNFKLRRRDNKEEVFHHNGPSWLSNGETPGFTDMKRCFSRDELAEMYKKGLELLPMTGERVQFLVENNAGCPGQCRVYILSFELSDQRFTPDEPNCAVNIDLVARPLRLRGNAPVCRSCS